MSMNQNLLTGLKDLDRLVLDHLDDKQLLEFCKTNQDIYYKVCDETFFRNRVLSKYPETVKYKDKGEPTKSRNWKKHFLSIVYYIDLLKTNFDYEYIAEDKSPELLYLARKSIPKIYDYNKNRALVFASEKGQLEVVKYLAENGADITAGDNEALRWASFEGQLSVIKYLVENGADITAENNESLIWASDNDHLHVVQYLVEHGADVTDQNNEALILASENGHLAVVEYLVEKGADITAQNNYALRFATFTDIQM